MKNLISRTSVFRPTYFYCYSHHANNKYYYHHSLKFNHTFIIILILLCMSSVNCAYGRIGDKDAFFLGSGKFKSGEDEIESRIMPDQIPIDLEYDGG